MAVRVTVSEVMTVSQIDSSLSSVATPAIAVANVMVDEHLAVLGIYSDAMLKQIELYLAAHFALLSAEKGPLATESVGDATNRYHDVYDAGLNATRFGQQAVMLDHTGVLSSLSAKAKNPRQTALFTVVGDPPPAVDEAQF